MMKQRPLWSCTALLACFVMLLARAAERPEGATPARLVPLNSVRILSGPFADAIKANQTYLLALGPDRLLAPFFREAGLEAKARPYSTARFRRAAVHSARPGPRLTRART